MLLTTQGGILKPFAFVLGFIMDKIFMLLDLLGIPNIGLSIIIFTIVVYCLMLPLTVKQQKFSKLNAKMSPELTAIRNKYQGKNDQDSMMRMQTETQMVYKKYGVSPSGSCVQLLISMPILFALYRVIYSLPAYVGKIRDVYMNIVPSLMAKTGSAEFIQTFSSASYYKKQFSNELFALGGDYTQNTYIDVLNRATSAEFASVGTEYPDLANAVGESAKTLNHYNNFLGLNIGDSPMVTIKNQLAAASDERHVWVIILAILIPLLAGLTQWINTKLMPQPEQQSTGDASQDSMAQSMKMMNNFMPIMSIVFCVSLPAGLGLYWVAGAVVRSIIQICVNKNLDKINVDEMVKANIEKENAKRAKKGLPPQQITQVATMNTRKVEEKKPVDSIANKAKVQASTDYYATNTEAKPGSLAAKAMMVKQYNEKNSSNGSKKNKKEEIKEEVSEGIVINGEKVSESVNTDDFREVETSSTDTTNSENKEI